MQTAIQKIKNTNALINKKKGIEITVGTYLTNNEEALYIIF